MGEFAMRFPRFFRPWQLVWACSCVLVSPCQMEAGLPQTVAKKETLAKVPPKPTGAKSETPAPLWPEVARVMGQLIERYHYLQRPMDEGFSRRVLERYLEELDPLRLYFYQGDVEEFRQEYGAIVAIELKQGNGRILRVIHTRFAERVAARAKDIEELLAGEWEFKDAEMVQVDRDRSPWPMDATDAWRLWKQELSLELIGEILDGTGLRDAVARARKRHEEAFEVALGSGEKERWLAPLSALAKACDAHSEYLTQEDFEDTESEIRLSRIGIGVTVDSDPSGIRVVGILPGGPAHSSGKLRVNDRIVAVAEGEGPFKELSGLSLRNAISLLRGKKGTTVRIQFVSPRSEEVGRRVTLSLKRQEMRSVEGEAYGKILEKQTERGLFRAGWISVPGFYGDDAGKNGAHRASVAKDVATLLARMNQEHVQGVVLDFRGNLGGLLEEAIELGGLFLGKVPIALVKSFDGQVDVLSPVRLNRALYDGPLVVVTNRQSASASELVSGALQDYRRAILVGGDKTFGKGSVQVTLPLQDYLKGSSRRPVGGLTLTVAKFYRVNGQATQLIGVHPDIVLPSSLDIPSEGENAMKDPLAHDAIQSASMPNGSKVSADTIARLQEASAKRVAENLEFRALAQESEGVSREWEENRASISLMVRREQNETIARRYTEREARMEELAPKGIFYRMQLGDCRLKSLKACEKDPLASLDPESLAWEAEVYRVLEDLAFSAGGK